MAAPSVATLRVLDQLPRDSLSAIGRQPVALRDWCCGGGDELEAQILEELYKLTGHHWTTTHGANGHAFATPRGAKSSGPMLYLAIAEILEGAGNV